MRLKVPAPPMQMTQGGDAVDALWHAEVPDDWDAWLADAATEASFSQTAHWALSNHLVNGVVPYVIEVRQAGRRIAGALFGHVHERTGTVAGAVKTLLAGRSRGWLESHAGPVILGASPARSLAALLRAVEELAGHLGVRLIRFSTQPALAAWPRQVDVAALFEQAGYQAKPWATSIVDIARPDPLLFADFSASARKGIRRCTDLNIDARECRHASDIESKFLRTYIETRRALGMSDRTAVEVPWLQSDSNPNYRFFIAEHSDGEVLGTLGTRRWNGIATEIYSERTIRARAEKFPVQDLLHWRAFVAHRECGDRWFDLAGFNPEPVDAKEEGIRAFKEKWHGRRVDLFLFEKGSPPAGYRLLKAAKARITRAATRRGRRGAAP